MPGERAEKPAYARVADLFGLTRQERLSHRVSDERLHAILADSTITVHLISEDYNNYGEFLFVTVGRAGWPGHELITFYGLGHHEQRETWITDEWYWYRSNPARDVVEQEIPKAVAARLIAQRHADIAPHIIHEEPSERAELFVLLADLTDEDAAYTELEDLGNSANFDTLQ